MEVFNIKSKKAEKLKALKGILSEGVGMMPELKSYLNKIDSIINTLNDGEISIVLLGSFSDGKTSVVAGLLGRLEENMKIDNDESSDELTIYRPKDLKKGFKIVDTPGLFGTKHKEIDGENVKFSSITEKYISEAHIIIYVCDAVVPLKDSHVEILRRVMRTYHKLDNTIFVINKMDEAGYDLLDPEDFARGSEIKKNNIISRLRDRLNLTPDEEKRLHVVCIAADPKGKGLHHWFNKIDSYYERSHIKDLRNCINQVVDNADVDSLVESSYQTSVDDVVSSLSQAIEKTSKPIGKEITKIQDRRGELEEDQKQLKNELILSKNELRDSLNTLKNDIIRDINGASIDTIGEILQSQIGVENDKVSFYVLNDKVNSLIERCCETNAKAVESNIQLLQEEFSRQNEMVDQLIAKGLGQLKNLTVTGEQVKAIRDIVASSYKFKPWGAINLGKNITKWAGWIGAGLSIGVELYSWYKKYRDGEKLEKMKLELANAINKTMADLFKSFESDESYFKNFAPSYLQMCQALKDREKEQTQFQQRVKDLEKYKQRIDDWRNSAEYAEYQEL